jgi:hypothetical protein
METKGTIRNLSMFRKLLKSLLPRPVRYWIRGKQKRWGIDPPVGSVQLGMLRRTTPISRVFGLDRGQAIDRYYIESFLDKNRDLIRGQVLEIGEDTYARKFGSPQHLNTDIVNPPDPSGNRRIVTDLTQPGLVVGAYDCIILTQTLNVIFQVQNALNNVYLALKPSGTILATVPGISQISRYDMDRWGDYWRFTSLSARQLFDPLFGSSNVTISTFGNVLAGIAFLHGLSVQDLEKHELDYNDPDYELLIAIKAVKAS